MSKKPFSKKHEIERTSVPWKIISSSSQRYDAEGELFISNDVCT